MCAGMICAARFAVRGTRREAVRGGRRTERRSAEDGRLGTPDEPASAACAEHVDMLLPVPDGTVVPTGSIVVLTRCVLGSG